MFRSFLIAALVLLSMGQAHAFSAGNTDSIVAELTGGEATCSRLEAVYQFDCYRQAYRSAAKKTDGRGDYRAAGKALREVEKTLKTVVRQNEDKTKAAIRVGGKTYKAIKPEAVKVGVQAFQTARNQAATKLLRSDGKAQVHYARIAQAMKSNKVLIRS